MELAFSPQRLPAGCKKVEARRPFQQALGQGRHGIEGMLAIVEHHEH